MAEFNPVYFERRLDHVYNALHSMAWSLYDELEGMPDCLRKEFLEDVLTAVEETATKADLARETFGDYLEWEQR